MTNASLLFPDWFSFVLADLWQNAEPDMKR
jgi:hypothetical protein